MHRWPRSFLLLAALSTLCLTVTPPESSAQQKDDKRAPVRFHTGDGVEIKGHFYAGRQGGPCVIMLHQLGKSENSSKKDWDDLARSLQEKGYAVLTFDFRGHGDSTQVEADKFWKFPFNVQYAGFDKDSPDQIKFERFKPSYYPLLVNDIAAAKSYLDRKNDSGEVNTNATILIGAGEGATLGAIWLNSEWSRFQIFLEPNKFNPNFKQKRPAEYPEGKGVIAAIWLTATPKLGARPVNIASTLSVPVRVRATPTVFLYAEKDEQSAKWVKDWEKALKVKGDKKYDFIGSLALKGADKASGLGLLKKSLGTDKAIIAYLDTVFESKTPERVNRKYDEATFFWMVPGGRPTEAKVTGDTTIRFNTYAAWIR